MIHDSRPVQKVAHLRFLAVLRVVRCFALSDFCRQTAGGASIANDGISGPAILSKCEIHSMQECGSPRQCIHSQHRAILEHQAHEIQYMKSDYENPAHVLAKKHRRAAKALTEKSRSLYRRACCHSQVRVETLLATHIILAPCKCFRPGINIRDGAEAVDLEQYCSVYRPQSASC
jgi:hypothetical protein